MWRSAYVTLQRLMPLLFLHPHDRTDAPRAHAPSIPRQDIFVVPLPVLDLLPGDRPAPVRLPRLAAVYVGDSDRCRWPRSGSNSL